ncbi:MAG: zinc ribbon domain-containing protein [Burkholderiales bacterium]|nr:zinc ribbon domain-containing protein [Burkholderiales bacterium]
MPIYEYRCKSCGFQKEFLQKMGAPVLTACPECGQGTLSKMVTAAGFHLKGTGWYATDFKNGGKPQQKPADGDSEKAGEQAVEKADAGKAEKAGAGNKADTTDTPAETSRPAADSKSPDSIKKAGSAEPSCPSPQ